MFMLLLLNIDGLVIRRSISIEVNMKYRNVCLQDQRQASTLSYIDSAGVSTVLYRVDTVYIVAAKLRRGTGR